MSVSSIKNDLIRYSESNRIEAIRALNGSERLLIEKIFQGYQGLESQISQKDLSQISKKISLGHKSEDQGFLTRIAKIFKRITILLSGAKSATELANLISQDWGKMPVSKPERENSVGDDATSIRTASRSVSNPSCQQIDPKVQEKVDQKKEIDLKSNCKAKKRIPINQFSKPFFGPNQKEVLKKIIKDSYNDSLDKSCLYAIWKDLHDPFSLVD